MFHSLLGGGLGLEVVVVVVLVGVVLVVVVVVVVLVGCPTDQFVHHALNVTVVAPLGGWVTVVTVGLMVFVTLQPLPLALEIEA
jgi:NADH:ubiquinone oxidoreductase subunit 6 (subunit J)